MLNNDRNYGLRSGFTVPFLNMGAMRFPDDIDESVRLIRYAIDAGYKYIDTSRYYNDSELKLKIALKDGYREKVILSTKWSPKVGKIEDTDDDSAECMIKRIEDSMRRLEVDYLDFYQLWCVQDVDDFNSSVRPGGMVDGMIKAKEKGLVGHLGMTSHDSAENIISCLKNLDWCESILVTFNILNTSRLPALKKLKSFGIATTVMNPLSGGTLAQDSSVMLSIAREVGCDVSAEMAIRYVMAHSDIDCIMNGINTVSDVDSSIVAFLKGPLSEEEVNIVDSAIEQITKDANAFCTGCKYCLPCPKGIDIPSIMSAIAENKYWGRKKRAAEMYNELDVKADECLKCGECERKCTQKLRIMDELHYADSIFS